MGAAILWNSFVLKNTKKAFFNITTYVPINRSNGSKYSHMSGRERNAKSDHRKQQFDSATTNYYQQDVACRGDNTLNI